MYQSALPCDFALPAEWEPQSAIMLTWPHGGTDWKPYLRQITNTYDGFLMMKSDYSVNLQFDKSFANRTWIIYLSANDIFKTTKERWTMYGQGSGTMKDCYNYTRSISLQIT